MRRLTVSETQRLSAQLRRLAQEGKRMKPADFERVFAEAVAQRKTDDAWCADYVRLHLDGREGFMASWRAAPHREAQRLWAVRVAPMMSVLDLLAMHFRLDDSGRLYLSYLFDNLTFGDGNSIKELAMELKYGARRH